MKVQFGSALSNETKSNAFITIPGLRGMANKEIAVKNLASIIQARMSEIMDFVSYHLKQVGLDSRSLNGGIILTGGGSQLKHVLQLTEYLTGLNARIGLPNEHLTGDDLDELSKPMYSTCIGLILKGYNDYENKLRANGIMHEPIEIVRDEKIAAERNEELAKAAEVGEPAEVTSEKENETTVTETVSGPVDVTPRIKTLKGFMDSFKEGIIDLFREEGDKVL
jgi:cell division protein FtsA